MTREIKFRAWDKENKKWVTPDDLVDPERMTVRCTDVGFRFLNEDESHFEFVMWTGLKDKNGKEIYEGDLIKCSYCDEDFGEVVWNTPMHRFQLKWSDKNCGNARLTDIDGWAEIIGNIYENPELL